MKDEMWGEAVYCATYLLNRLPSKTLDNKTPYEMWYKIKPDISNIQVFGCTVYAKQLGSIEKQNIAIPNTELGTRRSQRTRKIPEKLKDYVLLTYKEATTGIEKENWEKAIDSEKESLKKNKTWSLIDISEAGSKKILTNKWIFRVKDDGTYKARLVVRGFEQRGIDFDEIYSPVNVLVGLSTILDTRYKKLSFIDETRYKRMVEKLYNKVLHMRPIETCENTPPNNDLVPNQNMPSSSDKVDKIDDILFKNFDIEVQKYIKSATTSAVIEVDKYLQEPLLLRKDANGVNTDPLLWWFQRKHIYPRLYQFEKTRLSVMATSVPCERIFSHAGQIIYEKRENLKASKVSKVVFFNYNFNDTS
ncbi:unnamed protein product [Arctia plantaginis]|uniref:Uncharacterized protein n=2 Tax=Arctia plantaginis TaxID=874455 RepID=A0A8S1AIX1_ARCPL|nr:unnamed protein product [Arctia plantaginis]